MAATTVATMAATTAVVEGITAGDFVREVSSLGMHPESIIPSNTNLLEEEENQRTTDRSGLDAHVEATGYRLGGKPTFFPKIDSF
jgi:hypothetical protein